MRPVGALVLKVTPPNTHTHKHSHLCQAKLALGPDATAANDFLTYTINWQPDAVAWYANGQVRRPPLSVYA